ncbi:MAG: ribonuclease P protein component [Parcubacteria group bacterium]
MLPAEKRLVDKKDFSKVQRTGRRFFRDFLQLQFTENGQNKTRIGVVVGMRFSKKAVERNALKRKLREIFRQELKNIKEGTDIVVSARGKAGGKETYAAIEKTVAKLIEKSNLLNKS